VETVESQRQASHRSHNPWKSPQSRFPHFHSPGGGYLLSENQKSKTKGLYGDRGKVAIQTQDFHFPTVPIRLRRKEKSLLVQEEQLTSYVWINLSFTKNKDHPREKISYSTSG
jgi:hypothetical protein